MFVDKVAISAKAGKGGDGIVSFRHEKFIDKGGPDGGDGGKGGDIIFLATYDQNTLAQFRFNKLVQAEPGTNGSKRNKRGKSGKDLIVKVPVGTVVFNEQGVQVADLNTNNQEQVIAKGGKGGFGNAHFVSSRRQAPKIAELGEIGEEFDLTLELKMIADVGIVGLPNAGKSTLLSVVSSAKPEIANYPFTTLKPNLGVVDIDKSTSLVFADIPGLIEGASQGKGLGDDFLRHIERTNIILHLIDAYSNDVAKDFKTINSELKAYKADLSKKPQIIALTKIEGLDEEIVNYQIDLLKKSVNKNSKIIAISAQAGIGVKELLYLVKSEADKANKQLAKKHKATSRPVITHISTEDEWYVQKLDKGYLVTGNKIERFAQRVDANSDEGAKRLKDIMRKMGIEKQLRSMGANPGDHITIGQPQKAKLKI